MVRLERDSSRHETADVHHEPDDLRQHQRRAKFRHGGRFRSRLPGRRRSVRGQRRVVATEKIRKRQFESEEADVDVRCRGFDSRCRARGRCCSVMVVCLRMTMTVMMMSVSMPVMVMVMGRRMVMGVFPARMLMTDPRRKECADGDYRRGQHGHRKRDPPPGRHFVSQASQSERAEF
jgi:hypothetical protein